MEVTKREILFSTLILSIMLGIGLWLSNPILFNVKQKELDIISAVQVDQDPERFDYIGRTDVGMFLANGTMLAVDPVSIRDIAGNYMVIRKVKERYTMHTRTVTTTDGKGHTHTRVETYWTWDHVSTENFKAEHVEFLQKTFNLDEVKFKEDFDYHSTIKESANIRYVYYTYPTRVEGCMQGVVEDKHFRKLVFRRNYTIEDTINHVEFRSKSLTVLYWFIWFLLTAGLIVLFYYAENNWLEDEETINKRKNKYGHRRYY